VRLTVISGDRQVHVKHKGKSAKKLGRAEAAARRLLDATPVPAAKAPIGFSATSDTERIEGA
jgi:hypothetical protein